MSPRMADPAIRTALIEAAARLLAEEGPTALSTRRLATEVGTSTMTIYTHFGSMSELHAAVRREGFARLAAAMEQSRVADDPVAKLADGCAAYLRAAVGEPELYWAMFNHRPPTEDDAGGEVFAKLRQGVDDCVEAERFSDPGPDGSFLWAGEIWAALHGLIVLTLSRTVTDQTVRFMLADLLLRLCVGFGDDSADARRSIDSAHLS
ncbi:TetR/AcrR family transcriptional regulator [Micropruina sp.]|uniref:TetR/AcrR family transcriptional regulator n=1 Tax=Micropruina sp. TaxID=2737536 RepID=UPI0039E547C2